MIIRKLKETLGQVFHSPEAIGTWEVTESPIIGEDTTEIDPEMIECAIDGEVVDCKEFKEPYIGVPAPAYLEDDPWFGPAPELTEKQKEYQHQEATQRLHDDIRREYETNEPENIHEIMYQKATSNWNTVSETKQTQGGSENFHEGPGGWMSGNGLGQFNQ